MMMMESGPSRWLTSDPFAPRSKSHPCTHALTIAQEGLEDRVGSCRRRALKYARRPAALAHRPLCSSLLSALKEGGQLLCPGPAWTTRFSCGDQPGKRSSHSPPLSSRCTHLGHAGKGRAPRSNGSNQKHPPHHRDPLPSPG
jgi:hypothetical protein